MEVRRLGWLGMRTERFDEMVQLFRDVMNLPVGIEQPGRAMFQLPNGDPIDVFHTSLEEYEWFPEAPVVGFVVDDVEAGAPAHAGAGGGGPPPPGPAGHPQRREPPRPAEVTPPPRSDDIVVPRAVE